MIFSLIIVCSALLGLQDTQTIKFHGEARRGEVFEHTIRSNLVFRLIPLEFGWLISMGDTVASGDNFCAIVTPPYRGINHIYVEGWHFRNSDNSGPNDVGLKNVNAPGEEREFFFVLNTQDYQKAFDALQKLMWSHSYTQQEVDSAGRTHEQLPKGSGKLIVKELTLNNLEIGKHAGIDFMKFDVELTFPTHK
ncbi:MAG: hypothetical protein L0Y80_04170 [Ignavibacteriae bacterium]|nr:hypothetical protein [Ignavibacteriota bacterium]